MTTDSPVDLLVLHAVRLRGFAGAPHLAARFDLDPAEVSEALHDAQARGWVQRGAFADLDGWWLTDAGRTENERQLADELARVDGGAEVDAVHAAFGPLNARLLQAVTSWQLRPGPGGRFVPNDHVDPGWDAGVVDELADLGRGLDPLSARLGTVLRRLDGYAARFGTALRRARAGEVSWIDGTDQDSCHRVWFELHEDLIATLGIDRHAEG